MKQPQKLKKTRTDIAVETQAKKVFLDGLIKQNFPNIKKNFKDNFDKKRFLINNGLLTEDEYKKLLK